MSDLRGSIVPDRGGVARGKRGTGTIEGQQGRRVETFWNARRVWLETWVDEEEEREAPGATTREHLKEPRAHRGASRTREAAAIRAAENGLLCGLSKRGKIHPFMAHDRQFKG